MFTASNSISLYFSFDVVGLRFEAVDSDIPLDVLASFNLLLALFRAKPAKHAALPN